MDFDSGRQPERAAPYWSIRTADGKLLWASEENPDGAELQSISRTRTFGKPEWPSIPGDKLEPEGRIHLTLVPPAVLQSAREHLSGIPITEAYQRKEKGETVFILKGRSGDIAWNIRLAASGKVLKSEQKSAASEKPAKGFADYSWPRDRGKLELVLAARAPAGEMRRQLGRIASALWAVGPLTLAISGTLLILLVRWQLRPLAQMAEQASRIGPGNAVERIGPAGAGGECLKLRDSINSMLERLAEGLERERRFASSAAHELRTPLAQLKTSAELALRRERGASEYREALVEILADAGRLEKLISGLLHLARSCHPEPARGSPVRLADLLKKAFKNGGPGPVSGGARAERLLIQGDAELLSSAIANVLENAARYAPGSPPEPRVEAGGNLVQLVIADRGPGVPESDRARIFEPLTRLDPAGTGAAPAAGFGLGLAIARSTARAFGGELACRGRSDGAPGAEFVFTFLKSASPEEELG
jgi:signal transduction histidine kinase